MGMLWKKNNNGVNLLLLVHRSLYGTWLPLVFARRPLDEFGASITAYYKFNLMTNVSIENRLNL
jgi:hypothetical protein